MPKIKTHRRPPSIDLPDLIEALKPVMLQMMQQTEDRETRRLDVFERAFGQAKNMEQKVALAVAYLGQGK
jgi:hypothetical protein